MQPINGYGVCKVMNSRRGEFKKEELVHGLMKWKVCAWENVIRPCIKKNEKKKRVREWEREKEQKVQRDKKLWSFSFFPLGKNRSCRCLKGKTARERRGMSCVCFGSLSPTSTNRSEWAARWSVVLRLDSSTPTARLRHTSPAWVRRPFCI